MEQLGRLWNGFLHSENLKILISIALHTATTIEKKANLGTFPSFKSEVSIGFGLMNIKSFAQNLYFCLSFNQMGTGVWS